MSLRGFRLEQITRGSRWRLKLGTWLRRFFPEFRLRRILAATFGRSVKISVRGKTFFMDLRDEGVSSSLQENGVWESEETAFLTTALKPGMVFVDIGAHIGYYTVLASEIVGSRGTVYAFEPDPHNFSFLQKNVFENHCKNVVIEQKAITHSSQKLLLYLSKDNFGDHHIYASPEEETGPPKKDSVAVEAVSLDDYLKEKVRVDFLKMDIQGAEYGAFRGMHKTLVQNPDVLVLTEYWPHGLKQAGACPQLLLEEVRKFGFRIYQIEKSGLRETSDSDIMNSLVGEGAYTNLVFSRKALSF